MGSQFALSPLEVQKLQVAQELRETNDLTSKFGLSLTDTQIQGLVEKRHEALRDAGRIEFGQGIQFENRQKLDSCFVSLEYVAVKGLRKMSMKANALIVEQ